MATPEKFRMGPEGALDDAETVVWQVMYTTGSSGAPSPFVMTSYDYVNTLAQKRNMLRIRGVTEKDSLLSLFPLTTYPHGAFLGGVNTSPAFSIPVTIAMPGLENERRPEIGSRLDDVVKIAGRTRATILQGVPTYLRKVIARAQELEVQSGRDAAGVGHRRGPWRRSAGRSDRPPQAARRSGPRDQRGVWAERDSRRPRRVRPRLSATTIPRRTSSCSNASIPKARRRSRKVQEGLILLTHLDRRGTVLLRYAVGDVARISSERCPNCGMLTERIVSMPHRFDGLVKIKGMLVNPQLLVDAVMGEPDIVEFQAFVDKEDPEDGLSMDRLRHQAGSQGPMPTAASTSASWIGSGARSASRPLIEITSSDDPALKNRGWKTKPLIDLRAPAK